MRIPALWTLEGVVDGRGVLSLGKMGRGRQVRQGGLAKWGQRKCPTAGELANQTPLRALRLDYFNIARRRKFHLAFSSFLLQIKKYTRGCHDRRLASYSGALPFFLYGEYLGDQLSSIRKSYALLLRGC